MTQICCFLRLNAAAVMKHKQWSWKSETRRDQLVLLHETMYKMVFVLVLLSVLIHLHVFSFVVYLNKIPAHLLKFLLEVIDTKLDPGMKRHLKKHYFHNSIYNVKSS